NTTGGYTVRMFALKKGTYRVYVKMSYQTLYVSSAYQPNTYYMATVAKYTSDQGGTKKSKATTLKLKKSKQGIVAQTDAVGSSKGDWYKFKLTKKTKVRLYMAGLGERDIVTVQASGKINIKYYSNLSKLANLKSTTLPKGTYYIRVSKTSTDGSFYYKIGLNKKVSIN
ncbi:MAG: hypothetical protein Q4B70_06300, partial [Lachnospiraceae bacterium]|nr:hypothetical protein [Lachnospiraceae bacterium]